MKFSVPYPPFKDDFFNKGRLYAGCRGYTDCTTIHSYYVHGRTSLIHMFGTLKDGMKDSPRVIRTSEAFVWWAIESVMNGIPISIFEQMRPTQNEAYSDIFDDYEAYQVNSGHADTDPLVPAKVTFIDNLFYADTWMGENVWKYSVRRHKPARWSR